MCFFLIFVCGDVEKLEYDWRDLNTLEMYFLNRQQHVFSGDTGLVQLFIFPVVFMLLIYC